MKGPIFRNQVQLNKYIHQTRGHKVLIGAVFLFVIHPMSFSIHLSIIRLTNIGLYIYGITDRQEAQQDHRHGYDERRFHPSFGTIKFFLNRHRLSSSPEQQSQTEEQKPEAEPRLSISDEMSDITIGRQIWIGIRGRRIPYKHILFKTKLV